MSVRQGSSSAAVVQGMRYSSIQLLVPGLVLALSSALHRPSSFSECRHSGLLATHTRCIASRFPAPLRGFRIAADTASVHVRCTHGLESWLNSNAGGQCGWLHVLTETDANAHIHHVGLRVKASRLDGGRVGEGDAHPIDTCRARLQWKATGRWWGVGLAKDDGPKRGWCIGGRIKIREGIDKGNGERESRDFYSR